MSNRTQNRFRSAMRVLAEGAIIGVVGSLVVAIAFHVSRLLPGLPVERSMAVINAAMSGDAAAFSQAEASTAIVATQWYRWAILPGFAGATIGMFLGMRRTPFSFGLGIVSTVALAVSLLFFGSGVFPASWLGYGGFFLSLAGGQKLVETALTNQSN